jgi:chemotaxis protein MotA
MNGEEVMRREILIEGLADIQMGKNPKLIREELVSYMNLKQDTESMSEQQQYTIEPKKVG